jgi:hypothetical protein
LLEAGGMMKHVAGGGAARSALAFAAVLSAGLARAAAADEPATEVVRAEPGVAATARAPDDAPAEVAPGFYRDRKGRVMQVSFDFGRRLWLGVGYAPRLRAKGAMVVAPAAFDFGAAFDELSADGRTRHRLRRATTST